MFEVREVFCTNSRKNCTKEEHWLQPYKKIEFRNLKVTIHRKKV